MTNRELFDALGDLPEEVICEAKAPKKRRVLWGGVLAGAVLAAALALVLLPKHTMEDPNEIALSDRSHGVTAAYVDTLPDSLPGSEAALAWLSEEELLDELNTVIFRGTITDIRSLALDFDSETLYWSLAEIRVDHCLRGGLEPGETVSVLMEVPIVEGMMSSEADTIYQMRVGMEGIFMPCVFDDSSVYHYGDATLYKPDLAPYGFFDGIRFAFLQTDSGLIFLRDAYPSLAAAQTLDELEDALAERIS